MSVGEIGPAGEQSVPAEREAVESDDAAPSDGPVSAVRARASSSAPGAACLSDDDVLAFAEGELSERARARLEQHVDGCAMCQDLLLWATREPDRTLPEPLGQSWVSTFSVGQIVGERYYVERFVARGGMGEVYQAYDLMLRERVALKTMLCTASDDPRAFERLCHEVQLARRVAHPHVCRIYELHEHRDRGAPGAPLHFLAMEYIEGETLRQRLRRGPLPEREVRVIARQLLDALGAAHAAGVVHLDFKSSNVMLRSGRTGPHAVITDFGLSRASEREARAATPGNAGRDSAPGSHARAASALEPGPERDVLAYGIVLFELLTGRTPPPGASPSASREAPAPSCSVPSRYAPTLAPALDDFVRTCLASDPAARFTDATAALHALDALGSWHVPEPPRPGARRWLAAAKLGVALGAALLARVRRAGPRGERAGAAPRLLGAPRPRR